MHDSDINTVLYEEFFWLASHNKYKGTKAKADMREYPIKTKNLIISLSDSADWMMLLLFI